MSPFQAFISSFGIFKSHASLLRTVVVGFWLLATAFAGPMATAAQPPTPSHDPKPLIFGIFPFVTASELDSGFGPMLAQLQEALGRPVLLRTTRDYPSFMAALKEGAYDLAYVQPFDYVRLAQAAGYHPLVRRIDPLRADVVVTRDSVAGSVADLRGRILGLPPEVAAVSYLARGLLRERGMKTHATPSKTAVALRHFRTHDSCLQQLLVQNVDACAVGDSMVATFQQRMGPRLKVIERSRSIPPSLIAGHTRLGEEVLDRLKSVLCELDLHSDSRRILGLAPEQGLIVAQDRDYAPVRELWQLLRDPARSATSEPERDR